MPTESENSGLPPGPLRTLNPSLKRIFSDPPPKLPDSAETLCACCPAALWRAPPGANWVGLCTIFRDELSLSNGITQCEGYQMAMVEDNKRALEATE